MHLDAAELAALHAITIGPNVWATTTQLEARGVPPDALPPLAGRGLIESFGTGRGSAWILTPLSAEVLGVELLEVTDAGRLAWRSVVPLQARAREPKLFMNRRGRLRALPLGFADPIDPRPGPLEQLMRDEHTGEPVLLFGRFPITIDPRLGRAVRRKRGRSAAVQAAARERCRQARESAAVQPPPARKPSARTRRPAAAARTVDALILA